MTGSWWILGAEVVKRREERRGKEIEEMALCAATVLKDILVGVLGLSLMPRQDEETGMLAKPKSDEFTPMSLLVAHPEYLSELMDKMEAYKNQVESVGDQMKPVDAPVEEDLAFLDELDSELGHTGKSGQQLVWESKETQETLAQLVIPSEPPPPDEMMKDEEKPVRKGVQVNEE